MDLILLIVVYLLSSIIISIIAKKKQVSWIKAFLLSILLTPFAGAIYLNNTSHIHSWYEPRYKCPRCGFSFTEPMEDCPQCATEGQHIPLKKTYARMT